MDNDRKKVILYGSVGLDTNMGDQAMIFSFVEYITGKDNVDFYFLNNLQYSKRDEFKFKILSDIPLKHMIKELNPFLHFIYSLITCRKKFDEANIETAINIYKESDVLFCLNGFLLSSQMSFMNTVGSMIKILYARKHGKRLIILPQSVGPFDFRGIKKMIFDILFKKSMSYPEMIYLREESGYLLMKERNLSNIGIEHDIVLARNHDIDLSRILKKEPMRIDFNRYMIDKSKDILINPNFRLLNHIPKKELVEFFSRIIKEYLNHSKGKAYLFAHDYLMDREICDLIHEKFVDNSQVIYVRDEFFCSEIEEFMSLFDIGIVSRWHALVHSIRANLPVIIIGWSEKYKETARLFGLEENLFDIRFGLDDKRVIEGLIRVKSNSDAIKARMHEKHDEIKKTYVLERKGELWLK